MRAIVAALALSALAASPGRAQQQDTEEEPPAEYTALIDRALTESAASRWQEARALFRSAHEVHPSARALRGVGMVSYELRDYVDSVRNLRLALAESRRPLSEEQRAEATKLLERALELVARYDVSALPTGARLSIDGAPASAEPDGSLLLDLGEHTVGVRADGYDPASARLTVRGGEQQSLPVVLQQSLPAPPPPAAPGPALAQAPVAPPATLRPPTRDEPDDSTQTGPIVLMVSGGAVAVAGITMFALGLNDISRVEGADGQEWTELSDAHDRAPLLTGIGAAATLAGAAVCLSGLFWLEGVNGQQERSSLAFGPGHVRWRTAF